MWVTTPCCSVFDGNLENEKFIGYVFTAGELGCVVKLQVLVIFDDTASTTRTAAGAIHIYSRSAWMSYLPGVVVIAFLSHHNSVHVIHFFVFVAESHLFVRIISSPKLLFSMKNIVVVVISS